MPSSGGSSGGAFNGGTITTPLTVAPTNPASPALESIVAPVGFGAAGNSWLLIEYENTVTAMQVQVAEYGGGDHVTLFIQDGFNSAKFLNLNSDFGVEVAGTDNLLVSLDDSTTRKAAMGPTVGVLTAVNTAPASASIQAGECCLWFDQTNGASKLMAKAKSANGTVVTGSLALA